MANENLKKQMVVKLGTTTNTEAQLISNMVDGALSGKGGNDPELENLKKQMVIKLGTTTNEDAQIISNMVDNAAGGGSGSIPMSEMTIVNAGANAYDLYMSAFSGTLYLNTDNTFDNSTVYTINPNESLTIKLALIKSKLYDFILDADPTEIVYMVGVGDQVNIEFDTEDYSNVYSDLNNINILVYEITDYTPSKYCYYPTVIDITKPSSFTFTVGL